MELIPQGMTPLQPGLQFPNQSIVPSGPLVPQTAQQVEAKDLKYKISKFTLKYGPTKNSPHPKLPPIETLANTPITLGESKEPGGGYVAPGAGNRDVPIILSKFNTPEIFSGDALQAIFYALVAQVNKKGISGVFAVQDADQINPANGEDLRKGGTELTLLVYASEVREVRTIVKPVAKWPFKSASTTINDAKYRRITAKSPLQPPPAAPPLKPSDAKKPVAANPPAAAPPAGAPPAAAPPAAAPLSTKHGSLLDRNLLQDYLTRINRFPGRRVDVAVTASGEEGGVILDYIVHAERPPIFLFDQTSNTGAEASGTWRTRAGIELRQLAGYDDILDASFETSLSSATYSAFGSYQVTALFPDLLKFKVYGGYGRFLAEDVGQDNEQFLGKSATAGLLGIYTPYYFKGFPIDIIVGAEFKHVDIANIGNGASRGATDFLLPIFGLATDRSSELFSAFGSVQVEPNLPGVAGTDEDQLKNMGRFNVSTDFIIAKYSFGGSIFLEPILFPRVMETTGGKRRGSAQTPVEKGHPGARTFPLDPRPVHLCRQAPRPAVRGCARRFRLGARLPGGVHFRRRLHRRQRRVPLSPAARSQARRHRPPQQPQPAAGPEVHRPSADHPGPPRSGHHPARLLRLRLRQEQRHFRGHRGRPYTYERGRRSRGAGLALSQSARRRWLSAHLDQR